MEIENGGISQYITNESGNTMPYIIYVLRTIQANDTANNLSEFFERYKIDTAKQYGIFSDYDIEELPDDEFSITDDIETLAIDYLNKMQHIEDLVNEIYTLPYEDRLKRYAEYKDIPDSELWTLVCPSRKSNWEYTAEIIRYLGYPKIKPILSDLLEWLQDVNWPGAFTIIDALCKVDREVLMPMINEALEKAKKDNDELWIYGINCLLEEMEK